jgi:DNA mismatch endonuclease, patch repair protein
LDTLSPTERSARMRRVRGRDTKPELFVRDILDRLRVSYRRHAGTLPGHPDFAFPRRRKALFVHGCMWHQHPGCGRMPKSRLSFWAPKLAANRRRDLRQQRRLNKLGWRYLVVWECHLRDEPRVARRIEHFLEKRS